MELKYSFALGLHTHAIAAATFGTLGYFVDGWEIRQEELIKEKHEILRERRAAALVAE